MTTAANALVVLTKVPAPGQSKTRLVPPLSFDEAAQLARALLLDQVANLSRFPQAEIHIAFAPADAQDALAAIAPPGMACFPQLGDDLGERMANALGHLFRHGFSRVVLIGGDLPAVPLETLSQAFAELDAPSPQVVLGPTTDGGYYLVGMNRLVPQIFAGITWSQPDVLARTLDRLAALKIPFKLLPSWYDIDTVGDLHHLARELTPSRQDFMKNTLSLLRQLKQRRVF